MTRAAAPVALVLAMLAAPGLAAPADGVSGVILLAADADSIPLSGRMEALRDEEGQLTLDDVRKPDVAAAFAPASGDRASYTTATYWHRATLRNDVASAAPREWIVELPYAPLDYVTFHFTRAGGATETVQTGDLRHAPPEQLPYHGFAVRLRLEPGEEVVLHLQVHTLGLHLVTPAVWSPDAFMAQAETWDIGYGAYFGILGVMAFYNLIIFLAIRDRAYLYYVCWLMTSAGLGLFFSGYAKQYLGELTANGPAIVNESARYLWVLIALFGVLFIRDFLQTPVQAPRADRFLRVVLVLLGLHLAVTAWMPYTITIQLSVATVMGLCAVGLVLSIRLALRGMRAARVFVMAWGLTLAFVAAANLATLLGLTIGPLMLQLTQAATCLAVALLSLALADRLNDERRERARMSRLKQFFAPQVAEAILDEGETLLAAKRREVTVLFTDLRGFTAFAAHAEPEEVVGVLREYHGAVAAAAEKHHGNVEQFSGDGVMVFFNAPVDLPEHERCAVRMAFELRAAFERLKDVWRKRGYELGVGIGLASGFATVGAVGSKGRMGYSCTGTVTNLAARLCAQAQDGQVLVAQPFLSRVEGVVAAQELGERELKGIPKAVMVCNLTQPGAVPA